MTIPVTLLDARRQLRLEEDDDSRDDELQGWIDDAAGWVERYTGHLLVARDVTVTAYGFAKLEVPGWPIASAAAPAVAYDVGAGAITVPGARIDASLRPARLLPSFGASWPTVGAGTPVTATVRAGYESDDRIPGNFRRAMLVLIGAYDADREGGEIFAKAEASARSLCSDYRVRRV